MIYKLNLILLLLLLISGCDNKDAVFLEYINRFKESIQTLEKKNDFIYKEFEYYIEEKPEKISPYFKQVILVKKNKEDLINFLDSITTNIDKASFPNSSDNKALNLNQMNKKIKLKKSDIEQLKTKSKKFKSELFPNLRFGYDIEKYKESVRVLFSDDKLDYLYSRIGRNRRLIEFIADIYKLKADIVVAENQILNLLFNEIEDGDFSFHKIEVMVEPNSQILPIGYPYKAEIFLSIIDTTISHTFEIERKEYLAPACKGFYSFKVTEKPGKYEKPGNFILVSPYDSTIQKIPFKIEYEVLEKK
jgi:hypothetical protein